jgi:DNA-binding HxlR family transcriptional regulator
MKNSVDTAIRPLVKKVEKKPGCIQAALKILGDKWSPVLLGHLFDSPKTFGELDFALPGISPRTLSARLDDLESMGIIGKAKYCEHPPRYKYRLTPKGEDLRSILVKMADWGQKYS